MRRSGAELDRPEPLSLTEDLAGAVAALRAARAPDVAHATFRAVLDALARPGTRHPLPTGAAPGVPAVLLPTLALADLGVDVHVAGAPDWAARWGRPVVVATDATAVDHGSARLLVLGPGAPDGLVASAARGSAAAPEDAALVTCAVDDALDGGARYRLTGPGVDGERRIAPAHLPGGRTGVDLLLVDDDGVVGLPRSTRITHPDEEVR